MKPIENVTCERKPSYARQNMISNTFRTLLTLVLFSLNLGHAVADTNHSPVADDRQVLLVRLHSNLNVPKEGDTLSYMSQFGWQPSFFDIEPDTYTLDAVQRIKCGGSLSSPNTSSHTVTATKETYLDRFDYRIFATVPPAPQLADFRQKWSVQPCYWIPTTQYVENRLAEALPAYFKSADSERVRELEEQLSDMEEAIAELTHRLSVAESLIDSHPEE